MDLVAVLQAGIAGLGTVTPGGYNSAVSGAGASAEFPGNGSYGGMQAGDFVGNIRLDQTWGSAQVMAAAHELNAGYYATVHYGSRNTWRRRSERRIGVLPSALACG